MTVWQSAPIVFASDNHHGTVIDADTEDLTKLSFIQWLLNFDCTLNRGFLLLVNKTVWYLPKHGDSNIYAFLHHVKVLQAPKKLDQALPIRTEIAVYFKVSYDTQLLELWRSKGIQSIDQQHGVDTIDERPQLLKLSLVCFKKYWS
ncbi:hypothetical protein BGZ54_002659 [Gamsiella multidivaricata]|nr:hypothetical protein BGZ54_002659 [Gamsiella multidivaricata]